MLLQLWLLNSIPLAMETAKYIFIKEEDLNDLIAATGAGMMTAETEDERLKFTGQLAILLDLIKKQHSKNREEILNLLEEDQSTDTLI